MQSGGNMGRNIHRAEGKGEQMENNLCNVKLCCMLGDI